MDRLMNAMTVFGFALLLIVLFSVRRSHIRVEYSVSWLAASVALLLFSRLPVPLTWMARVLGLTYAPLALVLLVFFVFLIVFYRFSIVMSQLKDANVAMAQRLAILEFQLNSQHENR